jgi:hypothetical protein
VTQHAPLVAVQVVERDPDAGPHRSELLLRETHAVEGVAPPLLERPDGVSSLREDLGGDSNRERVSAELTHELARRLSFVGRHIVRRVGGSREDGAKERDRGPLFDPPQGQVDNPRPLRCAPSGDDQVDAGEILANGVLPDATRVDVVEDDEHPALSQRSPQTREPLPPLVLGGQVGTCSEVTEKLLPRLARNPAIGRAYPGEAAGEAARVQDQQPPDEQRYKPRLPDAAQAVHDEVNRLDARGCKAPHGRLHLSVVSVVDGVIGLRNLREQGRGAGLRLRRAATRGEAEQELIPVALEGLDDRSVPGISVDEEPLRAVKQPRGARRVELCARCSRLVAMEEAPGAGPLVRGEQDEGVERPDAGDSSTQPSAVRERDVAVPHLALAHDTLGVREDNVL